MITEYWQKTKLSDYAWTWQMTPNDEHDGYSSAVPLIDALVRRHDESAAAANAGRPSLTAALVRPRHSLSAHFLEHCGVAVRSGMGALFSGLLHLWIPGDFSFLAAVVASVCLAPTVGSTLSKAAHALLAALLFPPLAFAALLAGSGTVPRLWGYTTSFALSALTFLVVMASPPPTTRKLLLGLGTAGVVKVCYLSTLTTTPDAAAAPSAWAITDWSAVVGLLLRVVLGSVQGVGAAVVAALPFPRTACSQFDAELRAAGAGLALHAEAVVAAMKGEADPLSDEWAVETRRLREAVAEALAAAREHGEASWWELAAGGAAQRRRRLQQMDAMRRMAAILGKLSDAQIDLRAAADGAGELAGAQDARTPYLILGALAPHLRALCGCARRFAQLVGRRTPGEGARLCADVSAAMRALDAAFLDARLRFIYTPMYEAEAASAGEAARGEGRGEGGKPAEAVDAEAAPRRHKPSLFSGSAHQALIVAEGMLFLATRYARLLRDSSAPEPRRSTAPPRACCGGASCADAAAAPCLGLWSLGCVCGGPWLAAAARAALRRLVRPPPPRPPPPASLWVAGEGEEEEDDDDVSQVAHASLGSAVCGAASQLCWKRARGAARVSLALFAACALTW